ncbi:MAG: hypothetical protein LBM28_01695, partial [Oscillospiraceae bacterium]|nr:hypothetical protein [Oscillospiraceae bacterium]
MTSWKMIKKYGETWYVRNGAEPKMFDKETSEYEQTADCYLADVARIIWGRLLTSEPELADIVLSEMEHEFHAKVETYKKAKSA